VNLPPYQISVDGFAPDHFRVRSFIGKEAVSEAYSFDLVVDCDSDGDAVERVILGQRATLVFNVGDAPRAFHGIVASARLDEVHFASQSIKYRLRVVPRLWLLKRKQRTRIFQRMRVPEIVASVLLEAGISARFQLTRAYPQREYTTQYEETDYRFIKRILAEAGIYFYFPQGSTPDSAAHSASSMASFSSAAIGEGLIPGDTVICADDAACYPPLRGDNAATLAASTAAALAPAVGAAAGVGQGGAGAVMGSVAAAAGTVIAELAGAFVDVPILRFLANEGGALQTPDCVTRFTLRNTVRSSAAAFRDYDPDRPMMRLESTAVSSQPFAASSLSIVSGAASALGENVPSEVYEHHSPFLFPKWSFAADEAPRILRQKRRRASIASGESGCTDLCVGHRFALQQHLASHLDGVYVVVSVEHRGATRASTGQPFTVYANTFECAPAEMTYVPPRPKRTSVQVSLTATVVGPAGQEIHVDERGQIKVQFHWDRQGTYDEKSSCWIRTMQPWAGAAWGHQFIPRVGMEVVVVFEGGDPDKPMVLGSLYNGTHPPPFLLPGDKTRSGIRTQSSPGGGGFNELSFQDAAGTEQIYVCAQRNLDEKVGKNHTLLVQNDEFLRILGNRVDTIEKNLEERVKGDRVSLVEGNRSDVVKGNADQRVTGMLVTRVEGRERCDVEGPADLVYAGDLTVRVLGCSTTIVGKNDKKRTWTTHAEGTAALSGLDRLELSSDAEIFLKVGDSSLRMTKDRIELSASAIVTKGEGGKLSVTKDGLSMKSSDTQLMMGDKLVIKSESASISMGKELKLDGVKILLNSPDVATDEPPKPPDPLTKVKLADQDGNPVPFQRFVAKLDDGTEVGGKTDKEGKAELELANGGNIVFPDLAMADEPAQGDMQPYLLRQGDYLAKLAFAHGFDADKAWNDGKNAELKAKRKNPNILHPGDIVYFPRAPRQGKPLQKGTSNAYAVNVPRTTVRLKLSDVRLFNTSYVVEGLGSIPKGTTGADGGITLQVPVHVRVLNISFPEKHITCAVRVGNLDPVDERSGARRRLEHLGYRRASEVSETEADAEASDRLAFAAFQRKEGLEPTGELDDATKSALTKAHGS
jgi:uncharacterized protein involved in type VI secretion and phage assembly